MATLARNQVTVIDLSDAKQVEVYLSAKQGWGQTHNPDSKAYTPNFVSANNVITPQVYQTGSASNQLSQCSSIVWTVGGTQVTSSTSGLKVNTDGTLTISKNFTAPTTVKFEAVFTDSTTKATEKIMAEHSITYVEGVGALFQVVVATPSGDTFNQSHKSDLTAVATCYRGGSVDSDGITYTWEALKGGKWTSVTSGRAIAGSLTVKIDDVDSFQTFRVTAKDNGSGVGTAATATALVTFHDVTDPYSITFVMPQGDKIKNGTGSLSIEAQVWQGTEKVEDASTATASRVFTYTWTKYNAAGALTNWNGTTSSSKTGNPISVSAADISEKATIMCEISK